MKLLTQKGKLVDKPFYCFACKKFQDKVVRLVALDFCLSCLKKAVKLGGKG
jgi:hypothetical protein